MDGVVVVGGGVCECASVYVAGIEPRALHLVDNTLSLTYIPSPVFNFQKLIHILFINVHVGVHTHE